MKVMKRIACVADIPAIANRTELEVLPSYQNYLCTLNKDDCILPKRCDMYRQRNGSELCIYMKKYNSTDVCQRHTSMQRGVFDE
jgi:hypothetical protein